MSSASPTPVERALATAIYAPIGLGAKVVEDLPDVVTKACQRLVFARFIGKMAVDQGVRELRGRLDGRTTAAPGLPTGTVEPRQPDRSSRAGEFEPEGFEPEGFEPTTPLAPDDLALPDYDQLPAAHIVGKLAGLSSVELDAIEAYESAHRHRRTVLGKISQMRAA